MNVRYSSDMPTKREHTSSIGKASTADSMTFCSHSPPIKIRALLRLLHIKRYTLQTKTLKIMKLLPVLAILLPQTLASIAIGTMDNIIDGDHPYNGASNSQFSSFPVKQNKTLKPYKVAWINEYTNAKDIIEHRMVYINEMGKNPCGKKFTMQNGWRYSLAGCGTDKF